jgi:two-component system sensor histidine kinase ChvG
MPVSLRYRAPDGHDEVVTSVTPVTSQNGCWAVVTSLSASVLPGAALDVPYYDTPEIRLAGIIYLVMATVTLVTLWGIWRGLLQFRDRARAIRTRHAPGASFLGRNEVPELAGVAEEFDRLVETLQGTARDLRRTAEDNAHAFKTPVAIIRQSLEPVIRAIPADNSRAHRALGLIESSLDKIDALVASSRELDQAAADLLESPRADIDLLEVVNRVLAAHVELFRQNGISLGCIAGEHAIVRGSVDMVETVIENILENAVSFSAQGCAVEVSLKTHDKVAELTIGDQGPGVPAADLGRIFDRYYSSREAPGTSGDLDLHFGVGLWIVRRNIEALGGTVVAENRQPHGLMIRITLPLKRQSSAQTSHAAE